ncbi:hypothetical protein AYL99_02104 [Fonsecaea erecta]|uniref:Transmembrane protein 53 n=1 Tax=Fonsecaea erecta TaxID=1367422 RepID=A0A178ZSV1_9EURO|nr:hypothetical protein AYL99_02104 [Fonsecaea erecta]OAP62877.1 hypothetical protein AYL99_02104 [Fonsecaea erecta]
MELAGPEPEVPTTSDEEEHQVPVGRSDPYLAHFTQLGRQIYLYTPVAPSIPAVDIDNNDDYHDAPAAEGAQQQQQREEENAPPDPDLIIVCSWMSAQPRNIVKYTGAYRTRYPRARILLLRQDGGDFFFRTQAQQLRNLAPAVVVVERLLAATKKEREEERKTKTMKKDNGGGGGGGGDRDGDGDGDDGHDLRVLIHIFSNGGAWTACQLADAYYQQQSRRHQNQRDRSDFESDSNSTKDHHSPLWLLPITALVLDSTPSLPNMAASHTAICASLPKTPPGVRLLSSALVWGYLGAARAVGAVTGQEPPTLSLRRRLNDPRGAFTHQSRCGRRGHRVYIYSQADALIPAADVEQHAREAAEVLGPGGSDKVRLEDFVSSRHVGHVLADPERYWGIVDRVWRESVS